MTRREGQATGTLVAVIVLAVVIVVAVAMWGLPKYRIYNRETRGRAALQEATWTRRIDSVAAFNRLEVTRLGAIADSVEAMGIAAANRITMDGLGGPENYLMYKWIQVVDSADVIYVPTEANLPLLEATRRAPQVQP